MFFFQNFSLVDFFEQELELNIEIRLNATAKSRLDELDVWEKFSNDIQENIAQILKDILILRGKFLAFKEISKIQETIESSFLKKLSKSYFELSGNLKIIPDRNRFEELKIPFQKNKNILNLTGTPTKEFKIREELAKIMRKQTGKNSNWKFYCDLRRGPSE